MNEIFVAIVVLWLLSIFLGGWAGEFHGRVDAGHGLGVLFGPLGVLIAVCLPDTPKAEAKHRLETARWMRDFRKAAKPVPPDPQTDEAAKKRQAAEELARRTRAEEEKARILLAKETAAALHRREVEDEMRRTAEELAEKQRKMKAKEEEAEERRRLAEETKAAREQAKREAEKLIRCPSCGARLQARVGVTAKCGECGCLLKVEP